MDLYYFTASYPYGIGEQWKANELNELVNHFDKVVVVPYSFGGNAENPKPLPKGVEIVGPLFVTDNFKIKKSDVIKVILSKHVITFFREFFVKEVYKSKDHVVSWLAASLHIIQLLKNPTLNDILEKAEKNAILYFFWGKGSCEVLPFINIRKYNKIVVRMHRYDLFEYVNNNYIPYRGPLLNSISIAAPVCLAGKVHLEERYPNAKASIKVLRCGTIGNGKVSEHSKDKVFRIVSCSMLTSVKRVHLMIECLKYLDFPVFWRHIGDGNLRLELEVLAKEVNVSEKFIFEGMVDSREILNFYTNNKIDLLVNTSASEGVPISIMEAFSVGIPVMATDVGGTGEIVDDSTGRLVKADINAKELATELTKYYHLSDDEKKMKRKASFARYQEMCDAKQIAKELVSVLKEETC